MTKLFKSIPSIIPYTTIGNLLYGIASENNSYFIYLKKRGKHWVKRHGPYSSNQIAETEIRKIKDEYNAVQRKRSSHP